MIGTIVGIYNVGSMIGCVIVAFIGNILSRRGTIFCGCLVVIAGSALQAASFGVPQLIVGRIVTVHSPSRLQLRLGDWYRIHLFYCPYIRMRNSESLSSWDPDFCSVGLHGGNFTLPKCQTLKLSSVLSFPTGRIMDP